MLFQQQLGTLRDKTDRIQALLAGLLNRLALTLTTQPVRASVQVRSDDQHGLRVHRHPGRMGMHYARHDGEAEDVAVALKSSISRALPVMTCRLIR